MVIPCHWRTYRSFKELSGGPKGGLWERDEGYLKMLFLLKWAHLAANGRSAEHAFFSSSHSTPRDRPIDESGYVPLYVGYDAKMEFCGMAVVVQPRQINFLMKIRARNVSPLTIYWIFRESLTMLARSSYAPVIPRCYRRHKESEPWRWQAFHFRND